MEPSREMEPHRGPPPSGSPPTQRQDMASRDQLLLQKRPHLAWLLQRKRKAYSIDSQAINLANGHNYQVLSTPTQEGPVASTTVTTDFIPLGTPLHQDDASDTQEVLGGKRRRFAGAGYHESDGKDLRSSDNRVSLVDEENQHASSFEDELFAKPAPILPSFITQPTEKGPSSRSSGSFVHSAPLGSSTSLLSLSSFSPSSARPFETFSFLSPSKLTATTVSNSHASSQPPPSSSAPGPSSPHHPVQRTLFPAQNPGYPVGSVVPSAASSSSSSPQAARGNAPKPIVYIDLECPEPPRPLRAAPFPGKSPFSSPIRSPASSSSTSPVRSRSPSPPSSSSSSSSPARSPIHNPRTVQSQSKSSIRPTAPPVTRPKPLYLRQPDEQNTATPPWCRRGRLYFANDTANNKSREVNFYRALGQEIRDFADWVSPTLYESKARYETLSRLRLLTRITQAVRAIWPHANIHLFGSSKTKLCLSGSDIDLVVTGATTDEYGSAPLDLLAKEIRKRRLAADNSLKVLRAAKVPIIKMTDRESMVSLDLCLDNTSGPMSSEILIKFLQAMPSLKPLALVLKYFLKQQNKNEPFEGGMGSYLLVLLLIHLIQKRRKIEEEERIRLRALEQVRAKTVQIKEKLLVAQGLDQDEAKKQASKDLTDSTSDVISADEDEFLGRLFIDFFVDIGINLDYSRGICVRESGSVFDKSTRYPFCENEYLAVEDPENIEKDVGRGCWNIEGVRKVLIEAYCLLVDIPFPGNDGHNLYFSLAPNPSLKDGEPSILSRILWPEVIIEEKRRRYEQKYREPYSGSAKDVTPSTSLAMAITDAVGRGKKRGYNFRGRSGMMPTRGRGAPMPHMMPPPAYQAPPPTARPGIIAGGYARGVPFVPRGGGWRPAQPWRGGAQPAYNPALLYPNGH